MAKPTKVITTLLGAMVTTSLLVLPIQATDTLVEQVDSLTDQQRNLLRVALVLDSAQANNSDLREIIQLIRSASSPRAAERALRSLLPAIARSQGRKEKQIAPPKTQNSALGVTKGSSNLHWGQVYASEVEDEESPSIGVWLQVFNDSAVQENRQGVEGFDSDSRGWAVGIDRSIGASLFVGTSLTYIVGNVDSAQFGDDDNKSVEYNAYATAAFGKSQSLTASVSYSQNETDRTRFVVIRTDAETRIIRLSADIDSTQWRTALTWSGSLGDPLGFSVAPYLTFSHSALTTDDYAENGGGSLNLFVKNEDEEQTSGSVGLNASYLIDAGNWLILPSLSVSYEHDFSADPARTFSRFNNTPLTFDTRGFSPEKDRWTSGLGLQFLHLNGFGVSLGANFERQDDYDYTAIILSAHYDL